MRDSASTGLDASRATLVDGRARPSGLLLILAVWTIPAVLSAGAGYLQATVDEFTPPLRAAIIQIPAWYLWAALTPLVLTLARRFPIERPVDPATIAVHAGASLLAAAVHTVVQATSTVLLAPSAGSFGSQYLHTMPMAPVAILMYWGIVVVELMRDLRRRHRLRESQNAALAAQLAQAQLASLRAQLHPHFLFNTLNAITVLVHQERTESAVRTLNLLSEVLRYLLQGAERHEVSLREEIGFIERYLQIEQVRFSDRLHVAWMVDDSVLDALVPSLLLQPLVENAIRHGIAARRNAGRIDVVARRTGDNLELLVRDDGPGLPSGFSILRARGIGLRNTRERLVQLYGDRASFDIATSATGPGTIATARLPLRLAARRSPAAALLSVR
jgi:two-component system LytT family sensor kinase